MHRLDATEELLAKVSLFAGLRPKELHRVASLMTRVEVPAGTTLTRQGTSGHEFIIILGGEAEVTRDGEHIATVTTGDFQGEISLLDGGPRTATVTTTTATTVMVATRGEFLALLDEAPEIARQMLPALAHRVRAHNAAAHTH
jgi:CRP/FNR family cyclic AMP-dependent transcriptional regulator